MLYAILAVLLVLLDQAVKFAVRANIPLGGSVPFIPHVLDLAYVRNTGAAFSVLRQHTWLLTIVSLAVVLVLCWLIVKGFFHNALGRISAVLVLAGGVGNLFDRAVFGFVTDMFRTVFIDFPVFNVADCCVTVGVPLMLVYLLLFSGNEGPDGHGTRGKAADCGDQEEPAGRRNQAEPADRAEKNGSAGRWIAIGAAAGVLLTVCVWQFARAKAKKKEKETAKQSGKPTRGGKRKHDSAQLSPDGA